MRHSNALYILLFLAASLGSCVEDPDTSAQNGACDAYVDGLAKTTEQGNFTLTLMSSTYTTPPDVGDNGFTVQLTDASGGLVSGASIVVTPEMPSHGHGTTPEKTFTATEDTSSGIYTLGPMDLFMPGTWRLTFSITPSAGGEPESSVFHFCLRG